MKKIYNRFFSANNVMRGIFLALLVAPGLTFGQLYYYVGTGTATNSTTGYPCPMGNWYDGLREQHLYTASELNNAGFAAGSITEIAWDVSAMPSTVGTLTNYTVYVRSTTATSLSSWQTITGPADYQSNTNVSTGWNALSLNTPFNWNGTDNLLIQVCFENSCGTYTRNPEIKYSTATFTSSIYYRADCTSGMCTATGFPSTSSNRPNIRFNVIPPVADDAGVEAIVSPGVGLCTLGSLPTKVLLNNLGSDTLTSCTVNWKVGTSTQTPFSFTGSVAPQGGVSDTITLGNFTYTDGDVLTVWTSNPNNVADSFPNNDTITTTVYEALGGVYTIGGTGPDFATIADAGTSLSERGVCSAVTFNIFQGTYNEKVNIGTIPGASATNNVTFTFDPLNTAIVEISSNPNMDSNYVVRFNGASNVSFVGITIDGSSGSYGTAVDFNNAEYCAVSNCVINGVNTTSTSANYKTVNGTGGMDNMFMENEVNGGSYAMYWSGGSNVYVMGNNFVNPYYYGTYFDGIDMLKFNENKLDAQSTYQYAYGLYARSIDGASEFIGNELSWPGYGAAYFNTLNGTVNDNPTIANNMIHSGRKGYYAYGVYLTNCGYVNFYHNTVAKDPWASNGGFYGIYVSGGANKLVNNLFYDPNGSTSYYNFYYSGAFAVQESDYNNVYTNQNFGYLNGVQNTLSTWQTNTGFDMNSTTIDPGFPSFDTLRHCNDSLDGTGTPLSMINDDFDKDGRNPTTPDVGADEWVGGAAGAYSAGDDQIVCDGKTVEVGLAVTGGTFAWSTGDTTSTIEVTTAGTYTVAMTTECGSVHSDTVEVVDQTPTASFTITPEEETFLTGQFINTSQKGLYYMWIVKTPIPDTLYTEHLTYIFPDNGPYEVCLTTGNDCDTASTCDTWMGVVSVKENDLANMISLMPNPATDVLNIQFGDVDGDVTIELTNIQGQVVYSERYMNVNGNSTRSVNVSSLRKGMYIVKFMTDNDVATKQIIVQ